MVEFKNILLMLVIAVLFSIFSYSLSTAIFSEPTYNDYCFSKERYISPQISPQKIQNEKCEFIKPTITQEENCQKESGYLKEEYNNTGCVTSYTCETCNKEYETARENFRLKIFVLMSLIGVLGVVTTLIIKSKKEIINWILNGFLFGSLISLFVGTVTYFGDAPAIIRPIIMFVELIIVITVAIKKGDRKK